MYNAWHSMYYITNMHVNILGNTVYSSNFPRQCKYTNFMINLLNPFHNSALKRYLHLLIDSQSLMLRRRTTGRLTGDTRSQFIPPNVPSNLNAEGPRGEAKSGGSDEYSGRMVIKSLPFLSFLNPARDMECLYKQFKSPCQSKRTEESDRLLIVKTLGMRRRFGNIPMGTFKKLPEVDIVLDYPAEEHEEEEHKEKEVTNVGEPVVLWTGTIDDREVQVIVPEIVGKFLRPHQREGVQFLFDCGKHL
jgi:hypothetical protein